MLSTHLTQPQERANLAEQTLRQKEALLVEKERFQSDVQHFSQVGRALRGGGRGRGGAGAPWGFRDPASVRQGSLARQCWF